MSTHVFNPKMISIPTKTLSTMVTVNMDIQTLITIVTALDLSLQMEEAKKVPLFYTNSKKIMGGLLGLLRKFVPNYPEPPSMKDERDAKLITPYKGIIVS